MNSAETHHKPRNMYRELWQRVIGNGVVDAELRTDVQDPDLRKERTEAKADAREWFLENGEDFRGVCEMAGLSAHSVRKSNLERHPHWGEEANGKSQIAEY